MPAQKVTPIEFFQLLFLFFLTLFASEYFYQRQSVTQREYDFFHSRVT